MELNNVQKSQMIRKRMIIGAVTAIIASVLAFLNVKKSRTKRPKIVRQPYVNRDSLREANIDSVLYCGDSHCLGQIRMRPSAFFSFCNILVERGLLSKRKQMSVKEQVLIFLYLLGHNVRFRDVGGSFFRSTWTIHCYFHIVLQAILRLYPYLVNPPGTHMQPEIQNNPRFFPWFEDFIGAIDGTHVRASVPIEMQERFRGRKDKTTQNVLATVDFDLKFTYVLAGWEGSAHDSRVLGDALRKGFKVPEGKYYLADAGYGDRKGFMPLFRRVRYHLKEYTDNPPENEKELFNLRHSSLRMCIERAFGVLKKRFRVLDAEPFWSYETQVDVVIACCVIHNYLRGVDPNDAITREADLEVETHDIRKSLTQKKILEETKECVKKRNSIALAMWNAYKKHRTN
ncbi:protein ALP1-like [Chenopodium quinoa]|uniref:protein ALP1-like n=1 Tax=Chenopodium quinoa TaxID=63459 RepID=UPI000B78E8A3|nr:protein ALP1-like [Chenopodium quinoa]